MIIKKFTAKTKEEAMENAKKELGDGVVFMSEREVSPKGFFGKFKKKLTEVTVALEDEREIKTTNQTIKQKSTPATDNGAIAKNIEKKLDSLQSLLENQITTGVKPEVKQEQPAGYAELSSMKVNTNENSKADDEPSDEESERAKAEQDKFIRLLYNTLLDNEVDEKYLNSIFDDIDKNRKPNIPMDYILAGVYQKIALKFGISEGIIEGEEKPKTIFFIGPTGVGKTTTIAKIASKYAIEKKKKIALFTTDTYRIAAAEQLKTYASILEVPFRVIYTEEDMQNALANFSDFDYIFVDTAGHSHKNDEFLENTKKMYEVAAKLTKTQVFLTLSATTKYKDLISIADIYQQNFDFQIIFTKLDETKCWGNLYNLRIFTDKPIAFITCGQNVPNDFEEFNVQNVVRKLLAVK